MLTHLKIFQTLDAFVKHRKGEIKLGERVKFLAAKTLESLNRHKKTGVKFALLGIPESIGIRANQGKGGSEHSWEQFLISFTNQQSNRFLDGAEILCLGQVETKDLQLRANELNPEDLRYYTKLRSMCQELDQRVAPIIQTLAEVGMIPIVIGGGHNNAYPILKGMTAGLRVSGGLGCINCDAHADFRQLEGRHSGNPFSYAFYQGYLKRYFVMGLNENANSEAMLKNMDLEEAVEYSFHQPGREPDISVAVAFLEKTKVESGLEIDLDSIALMPASAYRVSGYSIEEARLLVKQLTEKLKPAYLHLTEGQVTEGGRESQMVGGALSTLVMDFIKSYPK